MRLALCILGTEVLALELDLPGRAAALDLVPDLVPEHGPPFGFSGSGGGYLERADPTPDLLPDPSEVSNETDTDPRR